MFRDDAIHDWAVTAEHMHRKCRKCGVHEWYFNCRGQWQRDIPANMFYDLSHQWKHLNHEMKYKWVSAVVNHNGRYQYRRANPQPERPKYERPEAIITTAHASS